MYGWMDGKSFVQYTVISINTADIYTSMKHKPPFILFTSPSLVVIVCWQTRGTILHRFGWIGNAHIQHDAKECFFFYSFFPSIHGLGPHSLKYHS